ncbi:MAG: HemK2/MTQ2 family protein methyltransferase [Thermoplasmata archaeon]
MKLRIGSHEIEIESCDGVYEPAEDSLLLAKSVQCGNRCLEIGSGTGIISIYCALSGSMVDAVDINPLAVKCTSGNAKRNDVRITARQSDLFGSVSGEYDTIVFNPPYLPVTDQMDGSEQWNGGIDGFQVTRRFLSELPKFLTEEGKAFMILSDLTDIGKLMNEFNNLMFIEIGKETFDFESIYSYEIRVK